MVAPRNQLSSKPASVYAGFLLYGQLFSTARNHHCLQNENIERTATGALFGSLGTTDLGHQR